MTQRGGASAGSYGGVARAANLIGVKVLNSSGSGSDANVIAGIDWCARRADVRGRGPSLNPAAPLKPDVVALGLDAVPGATPAQVAQALHATARDPAALGPDNDWVHGLIDVAQRVAAEPGRSHGQPTERAPDARSHDRSSIAETMRPSRYTVASVLHRVRMGYSDVRVGYRAMGP